MLKELSKVVANKIQDTGRKVADSIQENDVTAGSVLNKIQDTGKKVVDRFQETDITVESVLDIVMDLGDKVTDVKESGVAAGKRVEIAMSRRQYEKAKEKGNIADMEYYIKEMERKGADIGPIKAEYYKIADFKKETYTRQLNECNTPEELDAVWKNIKSEFETGRNHAYSYEHTSGVPQWVQALYREQMKLFENAKYDVYIKQLTECNTVYDLEMAWIDIRKKFRSDFKYDWIANDNYQRAKSVYEERSKQFENVKYDLYIKRLNGCNTVYDLERAWFDIEGNIRNSNAFRDDWAFDENYQRVQSVYQERRKLFEQDAFAEADFDLDGE